MKVDKAEWRVWAILGIGFALILAACVLSRTRAGVLDEFEAGKEGNKSPAGQVESAKPPKPDDSKPDKPPRTGDRKADERSGGEEKSKNKHKSASDDALVGIFMAPYGAAITDTGVALIAYGGLNSVWRTYPETGGEWEPRESGDALIPLFAFDSCYQRAGGDVTAWDYRGEIGLAFLAFQARTTFYDEHTPEDSLRLTQLHGLYRMSLGNSLEVDLGAGALTMKGDEKKTGFSATIPVLYHPNDIVGIEWRPVWSTVQDNKISDNDLAMTFGWRYLSIRLGYRWVYSNTESLSGPQVGLSLRW